MSFIKLHLIDISFIMMGRTISQCLLFSSHFKPWKFVCLFLNGVLSKHLVYSNGKNYQSNLINLSHQVLSEFFCEFNNIVTGTYLVFSYGKNCHPVLVIKVILSLSRFIFVFFLTLYLVVLYFKPVGITTNHCCSKSCTKSKMFFSLRVLHLVDIRFWNVN